MKRTVVLLFLVFVTLCLLLTGCSKEAKVLDFYNFDNNALSKLNNKEVVVYGYFLLNPVKNKIAYIAEAPLRAISNEQSEYEETTYIELNMQENGVIAVAFKEEPTYTSRPIKIRGTLKKGRFTDGYYFAYEHMITDAVVEEIPFYELPTVVQMYDDIAERGYIDTLYSRFLDLQLYSSQIEKEMPFPEFTNYEEIMKELDKKETLNEVEQGYKDIFNKLHDIYVEYKEDENPEHQEHFNKVSELYVSFDTFLKTYGGISPADVSGLIQPHTHAEDE